MPLMIHYLLIFIYFGILSYEHESSQSRRLTHLFWYPQSMVQSYYGFRLRIRLAGFRSNELFDAYPHGNLDHSNTYMYTLLKTRIRSVSDSLSLNELLWTYSWPKGRHWWCWSSDHISLKEYNYVVILNMYMVCWVIFYLGTCYLLVQWISKAIMSERVPMIH